ncbi:MAG: exosortase H [Deltaproteobacteria bacterium]|nr:exosortase H [Deltaproteobacteria bacterium]
MAPNGGRPPIPRQGSRAGRDENRRTIVFCLLFGAFLGAGYYLSIYAPVVERAINPFTAFIAKVSSATLQLLGTDAHASGTRLAGRGVSFELRNGCNGVWATIIFVSAVLAFPSTMRAKLIGVAAGFAAIFVINLIRVLSLYYIVLHYPGAFEGAHIYVWQSVVIGAAVLLWLLWARRAVPAARPPRGA